MAENTQLQVVKTVTKEEIKKRFNDALKNGTYFEYECLYEGTDCVRNTDLDYCPIIEALEAATFCSATPRTFYKVVRKSDMKPFSPFYDYYYDEIDGQYYAVRKEGGHG